MFIRIISIENKFIYLDHSIKMNGVGDQYGDSRLGAYWSMDF